MAKAAHDDFIKWRCLHICIWHRKGFHPNATQETYSVERERRIFIRRSQMRNGWWVTLMTASFSDSHLKREFKFVCKLRPIPSIIIKSTLFCIIISSRSLRKHKVILHSNRKVHPTHSWRSRKFKQHPAWPDSLIIRLPLLRQESMMGQHFAISSITSFSS